jgi:hypothetical protein
MFPFIFYSNVLFMGGTILLFHQVFKSMNIEKQIFEKYSVNMMRSLMCSMIANESFSHIGYLYSDRCLSSAMVKDKFIDIYYFFLSYFVFDTVILFYQVYLKIEKNIRLDLLLHHILAITAFLYINHYQQYGIVPFIGMSEAMSIVSGPKLLSVHYGNKYITNIFIFYRLCFLVYVRMLIIWPSLILYYMSTYYCKNNDTNNYTKNYNIFLVVSMVAIIFHAEIRWLHSGRNELSRI